MTYLKAPTWQQQPQEGEEVAGGVVAFQQVLHRLELLGLLLEMQGLQEEAEAMEALGIAGAQGHGLLKAIFFSDSKAHRGLPIHSLAFFAWCRLAFGP